jgi:adenosine kinase
MKKFKAVVLGPIPRDHITTHKGEIIEKYGCATHTAIGLSRLLEGEGTVWPVSHVRKIDKKGVLDVFAPYSNISTSYIRDTADQGDVIQLRFVDQNTRLEKQTGFMNPIIPEDLEGLMDADVFVCVPITDYEVPLATLRHIKENSNGIIIFDAHGPTNTVTTLGDRLIKFWIDRDQWLPYIDILKMNLEESRCCWFEKEYDVSELGTFHESSTAHLDDLAQHVLERGVTSLIVTLDSSGSMVYFKAQGKFVKEMVSSVPVKDVVDTTGCGDSFAGGLGFGLLEDSSDFVKAARYANALGAQRTQGRTFEVFKNKSETDKMIRETYNL